MEGQEAPQAQASLLLPHDDELPPQNSPNYLLTLPNSLIPMHPPVNVIDPQPAAVQLPDDIDWVALLSGQSVLSEMNGVDSSSNLIPHNQEIKTSNDRMIMRKISRMKKHTCRPRFAFQTRSADDILDDGYRWRKYGQKAVKNSSYPRSYYRCTHHTCNVKKQIQRLTKDTSIVVTTYEGTHNHPCEKLMETLTPLLKQMQFLARF